MLDVPGPWLYREADLDYVEGRASSDPGNCRCLISGQERRTGGDVRQVQRLLATIDQFHRSSRGLVQALSTGRLGFSLTWSIAVQGSLARHPQPMLFRYSPPLSLVTFRRRQQAFQFADLVDEMRHECTGLFKDKRTTICLNRAARKSG